jgi:hypothetical protein
MSALVSSWTVVLVGVLALAGTASAADVKLRANLHGDEEVPPADPDGDGRARVTVIPEDGRVCFKVKFDEITTANRGHIHVGGPGVNGDIVVAFFDLHLAGSQGDPRLDTLEKKSELEGCVENLDPALLEDIVANPGNYYVNLHNSRFPGGAVRGQLEE